jgi:hypothetical protein
MYLLSTTGFQSRYQDIAAQPGGTLVFSRVEDFPHNFVDGRGMGCRLMPHQSDLDRPDSAARDVASVYHNLYDGVPVTKNGLPPTSLISQFVCQHRDSISLLAGYRNEYDEGGGASLRMRTSRSYRPSFRIVRRLCNSPGEACLRRSGQDTPHLGTQISPNRRTP